jgi:hypothetical protein
MKLTGLRPMSSGSPSPSQARVLSRRRLRYADGADARLDRPAHVRAGSGCCFLDARTLAVVQDDANFLALVDVATGEARAIPLPVGAGGLRQFDRTRGNKQDKWDLEACLAVDGKVVLLGSGSTDKRERVVEIDPASGQVQVHDMHALYEALRRHPLMAGAELNIEGAIRIEGGVRLFQRGNGAGGVNATFDVPWPLAPPILAARRWDLGDIDGVALTLTDATRVGKRTLVVAAAEASPNTYDDGKVFGAALGFLEEPLRLVRLPIDAKPEGIAADPARPGVCWLVTDNDDPNAPAELIEVALP